MPRKPKKPCKAPGCRNLTEKTYCEEHDKIRLKSYKDYNRYKRDKDSEAFYNSSPWRKLSKEYRINHPLCELCLSIGIYTPAQMVDHIVPIRQGGARLDESNLQSLCYRCHEAKSKKEGSR